MQRQGGCSADGGFFAVSAIDCEEIESLAGYATSNLTKLAR